MSCSGGFDSVVQSNTALCFRVSDGRPGAHDQLVPRVPCGCDVITGVSGRVHFCGGQIRQYGLQDASWGTTHRCASKAQEYDIGFQI